MTPRAGRVSRQSWGEHPLGSDPRLRGFLYTTCDHEVLPLLIQMLESTVLQGVMISVVVNPHPRFLEVERMEGGREGEKH